MSAADVTLEEYHRGGCRLVLVTVGDPGPGAALADRLAAEVPPPRFVAVVSADLGEQLARLLAALSPVLAEVICADAVTVEVTGQDLAMTVLQEYGIGQDFVFTVPDLDGAIDYACRAAAADASGWEGDQVLVLGPPALTDRARRHLSTAR